VTISVSEIHITNGNQASDFGCALGLAFKDAGFDASVGDGDASFYLDGNYLGSLPLPADARFWNNRLDLGQKVEPFEFDVPELKLPVTETRFPEFSSAPVT
jgi:hypothetical protein